MAGLVAAARARELGASVVVHEKGDRAGGSMLLSGGFVWRYREWEQFRKECPRGETALQRLVWERLDDALSWLESRGAPALTRETGNPLTTGVRFDTRRLTEALVRSAGEVRLRRPLNELPSEAPVVLATGGFQGDEALVRRYVTPEARALLLRANPWSVGDGLRLALLRGAGLSDGMDEFWGRAMPAPPARVGEPDFRRLAQSFARHARVVNERGDAYAARTWSEIDVAQWIARQPRGRAWFHVADDALDASVRRRTVREMLEAALAAGGRVERRRGETVVEVVAGITTTLGGIRIDERARAAEGLWVVGADAGGISTGGWASTLASALVFGLVAAEDAVASDRGRR
ncbi:MAG: FAD-binding protein [Thermoleophilia bacterium]|nr:FAD-binding protein [Thermoleophilia bacterium]